MNILCRPRLWSVLVLVFTSMSVRASEVSAVYIGRTGNLFDVRFTVELDSDITKFSEAVERVDWLPLLTPMVENAYFLDKDREKVQMNLKTCLLWKCWYLTKISHFEHRENFIEMHNITGRGSFIIADEIISYAGNSSHTTISYSAQLEHKYKIPQWVSNKLIAFAARFEISRGAKRLEEALNNNISILSTPF